MQTAIISVNNINQSIFVMKCGVFFEVWTDFNFLDELSSWKG
jgi:hypothetical protein